MSEVVAVEDLHGPGDATQFTTTEVFRRARPDEPLVWSGQIPSRLARLLDAAGSDVRALVDPARGERAPSPWAATA